MIPIPRHASLSDPAGIGGLQRLAASAGIGGLATGAGDRGEMVARSGGFWRSMAAGSGSRCEKRHWKCWYLMLEMCGTGAVFIRAV